MTTLTQTDPQPQTGTGQAAARIVSRPLALVFLAEFCALSSFYLLVSVTPVYAATAGSGGAGLVTGVLLAGTVVAELASAVVMRRFAHRSVLVAGALLLGVPALLLHPGSALGVIVAVSLVRGIGFGLSTVVAGALTAMLLPPERRGEGLGLYGVVATAPGIVALPLGVWLAGHFGGSVVILATAVTALVPLAGLPWLPGGEDRGAREAAADAQPTPLLESIRRSGQIRLALIFASTTVAAGIVVSFLPLAAGVSGGLAAAGLLAQSLTATVSRWWAGRFGDRHGHARLLAPSLLLSALALGAMLWPTSAVAVLVGMSLFGVGFGIVQNATFALMIERMPSAEAGTASALWNLAFDAGYGAGPAAFGLVVGHTGYPAAFIMTGAVMLAAVPAAGSRAGRTTRRA
ncbi:MFS transporter [Actinospica robiniae]|uniref:MFS transporter n=1 Tax=Actinospica robiniae TaxID=304901 RepID=UPI0003FE5AB0|nr:MFS transporter [Actinospica robiniae]